MKPDEAPTQKQTIRLEKIYPHPPERVWQALTDPHALAQWLLPTTFEPRLGYRFRFTHRSPSGKPEKVRCQVVELEAPCRLAYTWQAEGEDVPTLVTWTLEPVEAGTCLRLEHIGPNADVRCSAFGVRCLVLGVQDRIHGRRVSVGRIVLNNQPALLRCISHRFRASCHPGLTHPSRLSPIPSNNRSNLKKNVVGTQLVVSSGRERHGHNLAHADTTLPMRTQPCPCGHNKLCPYGLLFEW